MGAAFGKMKAQVLVVGLDNSGKTSVINSLKDQKQAQVAPTVGFNKDSVEKFNLNFQFTDMSGQKQYRDMWEQFAQKIDGLIFVIDSADKLRFSVVVDEFKLLLGDFDQNVPILIYANKQDFPDAQAPQFFIDILLLKELKNPSQCYGCSAKTGEGLDQGLQWLSAKIQMFKKK